MVDFHDRRDDPNVADVLSGLYDNGYRYRVTTGITENGADAPVRGEGYLTPGETPNTVRITPSKTAKKSFTLHQSHIVSIQDSRSRKGERATHYSKPAHVQDGYGRL